MKTPANHLLSYHRTADGRQTISDGLVVVTYVDTETEARIACEQHNRKCVEQMWGEPEPTSRTLQVKTLALLGTTVLGGWTLSFAPAVGIPLLVLAMVFCFVF